ncbi:MAG: serine hydrolase [Bacteroidales bacterium]|nr:serine hydrolase [Bacteroidales bacterium]
MKRIIIFALAALASLALNAQVKIDSPRNHGMDPERLSRVDGVIEEAIRDGEMPGAVLSVVRGNHVVYLKAYGNKSVVPKEEPMTVETFFDLASLSKCVGTTLSVMQLIEDGRLRLNDPVKRFIPEFKPWTDPQTGETVDITIRDLMTHSSGLSAYYDADKIVARFGPQQPDSLMRVIATEVERHFHPGSDFLYSCLNFITLQHILERVTGERLCDYAEAHVFAPLGLRHTGYLPLQDDLRTPSRHAEWLPLIAPTEVQADGTPLLGAVHDPLARLVNGGNSGNAGVFSDAVDLSRICMMIMRGGSALADKKLGFPENSERILSRAAIRLMGTVPSENDPSVGRALGWDVSSAHSGLRGDLFNPETCLMHTGYTGTSILIDTDTRTAVVLLTNRVHPTDDGAVGRLRAQVANIVASSIIW